MQITSKNREIWKALLKAAEEFRHIKPWKHFNDSLLFGVQNPESGEIGWCAVIGAAGEVYGLVVYLGDEGFAGYEDIIQSSGMDSDRSITMRQRCLKVEFVSKSEMYGVEMKALNQLGLKYKSSNQYINFRRIDPNLYPWYIEGHQAEFLTHCIQQSLGVIENTLKGKVDISEFEDTELLVMIPEMNDGKIEWNTTYLDAPEIDYVDDMCQTPFWLIG